MSQLFLTSSVHAVAHDIAAKINLSIKNKLLFIDTAAEPEEGDKQWLKNDRQALVESGFAVSNYSITGKSSEELKQVLPDYDYIYLSGGDTSYLLEQSLASGFYPLIQDLVLNQDKIYIGTSAGSIIAGPVVQDYLLDSEEVEELTSDQGYGLVNFTVMPHWGSADFKSMYLGGRLEMAYKENQVPLIILTDNQYVYVQDKLMQIIDVAK